MVEMKVSRLTKDPLTNLPIVILTDRSGKLSLPLNIGANDASGIASELAKVELQRPTPHDLMKTILGECGVRVTRVELHDVEQETFYAAIVLERSPRRGGPLQVDARPSDAIALALRTAAPIRVAQKVIDRLHGGGAAPPDAIDALACGGRSGTPRAALVKAAEEPAEPPPPVDDNPLGFPLLESLADEDFGKWKM
jgi:bifunctional DNase/RNase